MQFGLLANVHTVHYNSTLRVKKGKKEHTQHSIFPVLRGKECTHTLPLHDDIHVIGKRV